MSLGVFDFVLERAASIERGQNALIQLDLDFEVAVQAQAGGVDGDAGVDGPPIQQQSDEGLDLAFLHIFDNVGGEGDELWRKRSFEARRPGRYGGGRR